MKDHRLLRFLTSPRPRLANPATTAAALTAWLLLCLPSLAQAPAEPAVPGWANLQWPATLTHTVSVTNHTEPIYGQVWIDGLTGQPGAAPNLAAQLGFGPEGSNPDGDTRWIWTNALFNVDAGNNDEFKAALLPESAGAFDYLYRYSVNGGKDWLYADLNGLIAKAQPPAKPGKLTVKASGDTNAPAAPTGLLVRSVTPASISLRWNRVAGDPTLYGYEVLRGSQAGGPYQLAARVTESAFTDTAVQEGKASYYVVRSVDHSFNRSGTSLETSAVAGFRKVTVTLHVTVPETTDGAGRPVHIAGSFEPLDNAIPEWDPGAGRLTRVSPTQWTIKLTGKEGARIEYKYALGSWDYVEKSAGCEEIGNREIVLTYGAAGEQTVADTVQRWRNVAPCGN